MTKLDEMIDDMVNLDDTCCCRNCRSAVKDFALKVIEAVRIKEDKTVTNDVWWSIQMQIIDEQDKKIKELKGE